MADFFTADLHLNHANIIKYCGRPFLPQEALDLKKAAEDPSNTDAKVAWEQYRLPRECVDQHDQVLIDNINEKVSNEDRLFLIGDIYLGGRSKGTELLSKINGRKYWITGGHDDRPRRYAELFDLITPYYELNIDLQFLKKTIVMFHYPIAIWNKANYGSWHLCGHSHGNYEPTAPSSTSNGLCLDVGVDLWDFKPLSLCEIDQTMNDKYNRINN